ncbi:MAG: hypothetical protein ACI90A_001240 [Shewanella sp.]|jgi:hypothetical protein
MGLTPLQMLAAELMSVLDGILRDEQKKTKRQTLKTSVKGGGLYTNQYKDLIAQREFSGPEVRSLIAPR